MEIVTLKNGTEEAKGLVQVTRISLEKLFEQQPVAFCELVACCKERGHKPQGNTGETLQSLALLQPDNSPHGSIRNIVLSAVEGDGLEMKLVSPCKQEPTL